MSRPLNTFTQTEKHLHQFWVVALKYLYFIMNYFLYMIILQIKFKLKFFQLSTLENILKCTNEPNFFYYEKSWSTLQACRWNGNLYVYR